MRVEGLGKRIGVGIPFPSAGCYEAIKVMEKRTETSVWGLGLGIWELSQ